MAKDNRAVFSAVDNPHGDFRCRKIFPVEGVHVPLNGVKPHFRAGVYEGVVVIAIRRTKQGYLLIR